VRVYHSFIQKEHPRNFEGRTDYLKN